LSTRSASSREIGSGRDAQVLERHRDLVSPVQDAQCRRVSDRRARDPDAPQVSRDNVIVH
jgi:hypothetical protein